MKFKGNLLALVISSLLCVLIFFIPETIGKNYGFWGRLGLSIITKPSAILVEIIVVTAFLGSTIGEILEKFNKN